MTRNYDKVSQWTDRHNLALTSFIHNADSRHFQPAASTTTCWACPNASVHSPSCASGTTTRRQASARAGTWTRFTSPICRLHTGWRNWLPLSLHAWFSAEYSVLHKMTALRVSQTNCYEFALTYWKRNTKKRTVNNRNRNCCTLC